ncbi:MAG: YggS family pyridoxal phosphate-dependent enzyme [Eubacteriales bacterium]|nr:YggS family pyridoxal phosphate-dependent enzyme [Eubacteriales bacterium]
MSIKHNYFEICGQITAAMQKAKRTEQVQLIAVSKTRSAEEINELFQLGQLDFGENKPQEIRDKIPLCSKQIRWHMIGHLQSNKLKYVVGKCHLIHSVNSIKLAEEINQYSQKLGVVTNILLQLNIAEDENKQGFTEEELDSALKTISEYSHIRIHGLMTIAPFVENPEENRWVFQKMRQIFVDIPSKNYDNVSMNVLSMGMSNDYAVAIEEGATHVRIGTAIFGERNYNKEI